MPALSNRWLLALAGAVAYVAVALLFGGAARAGRDKVPSIAKQAGKDWTKNEPTPLFYGVQACNNPGCHGGNPPKNWVKDKDVICRCTEALLWEKHDKHADAYNVLNTEAPPPKAGKDKAERARRMEKILQASKGDKNYKVTNDPACLACHSVVIEDKKLLEASAGAQFKKEEGVNCVVCHGASEDWVAAHGLLITARSWRPLTRAEKEKHGGMRDLWGPVKRAELCTSCHVGSLEHDPKKGVHRKFVTHEMYAAGHPPLPGFEAAMFSEEMPRHWEYLREKSKAVRKELGHVEGEQEQTRLLLVGSAVALRESMRLLVKQAQQCQKAEDDDGKVLDLANFDCYACHHDLKPAAWRPKRGYPGKPGRVPMREWPTELIKLGVVQAAGAGDAKKTLDELAAAKKKLSDAFVVRPYGDPAKVEKAATELAKWADALAKKLNKPVLPKDVKGLLGQMPTLYGKAALDYDSARQVGWAFDVLYNELHGYPYKRDGVPESKDTGDAKVRKAQEELSKYLRLRLPQGRTKIIEDELADNLKALNAYEPAAFRKKLQALTSALGK
jgi:hypothetical protein